MMNKGKNILHVVNIYFVLPYFIGGQFKHFHDKGYKMNVACSKSPYLKKYAEDNQFEYIETPVNRSISISQDLKTIRNIFKFSKKQKIDIIVGHTPKGGLLAMCAGWLKRIPIRIYFRHGLVYETSHGLKRFILMSVDRLASALATKIVCVSPSVLRRSIEDQLAPASKQIILGKGSCNGIDTEGKFNPTHINDSKLKGLRAKWGLKEDDIVIGYTGRLVRDKGTIELVKAFDILKKEDNKYKLLLMGMFEVRDALPEDVQKRIEEDENIIYTGFINTDQEYYYALMSCYVLPSYREGFPTGVLEAQSMEVPVVTTNVTGCCDSIIEGETGFFTTREPKDLACCIASVKPEMGKKGRQWVRNNFKQELVWEEIEKLYQL